MFMVLLLALIATTEIQAQQDDVKFDIVLVICSVESNNRSDPAIQVKLDGLYEFVEAFLDNITLGLNDVMVGVERIDIYDESQTAVSLADGADKAYIIQRIKAQIIDVGSSGQEWDQLMHNKRLHRVRENLVLSNDKRTDLGNLLVYVVFFPQSPAEPTDKYENSMTFRHVFVSQSAYVQPSPEITIFASGYDTNHYFIIFSHLYFPPDNTDDHRRKKYPMNRAGGHILADYIRTAAKWCKHRKSSTQCYYNQSMHCINDVTYLPPNMNFSHVCHESQIVRIESCPVIDECQRLCENDAVYWSICSDTCMQTLERNTTVTGRFYEHCPNPNQTRVCSESICTITTTTTTTTTITTTNTPATISTAPASNSAPLDQIQKMGASTWIVYLINLSIGQCLIGAFIDLASIMLAGIVNIIGT